ncbi:MAG: glycosyltransferase [Planctomycetota bacterium]|nr:glycosyltransferase [Planctomycetota bacterium]
MASNRIRVLLCSSSMDGGGSEKQLLYLLKGLDRTRFEPILYLLYESGVLLDEVPKDVKRFAFWTDNAFPRWNWPGRIHHLQVRHMAKVLQREEIDAVYDRLFHMTLITGPATQRTQTPRISTIVSPPQYDLARSEKRWLSMKKRTLRKAYSTASALLTVGAGTADNASDYYNIPRNDFQVMVSPIDIERIDSECQRLWTGSILRPNRKQIISIGRLSDEKGHRYLIQAFAKYLEAAKSEVVPPSDLHLVGDGVLRKELQSLAASLGVDESVFFHGQIQSPFSLLKQCDLICLPSIYEGMPNVLLEAMACKVPILATNTTQGAGELFRTHALGTLVPKANAEELAKAIQDRFVNPAPWLEKLEPARAYVETHHSLSTWIENISQILENIARKN